MDTIEQTVRQVLAPFDGTLPEGAEQIVNEVIATLTDRENAIAEQVQVKAVSYGLGDSEEVKAELVQTGIQFRPMQPTLRSVDSDASEQQRNSVVRLLDKLSQNRRQHRDMAESVDSYVAEVKQLFGI